MVCVIDIYQRTFILKIVMYYVIQVASGKEQKVIDDIKKYKGDAIDFDVFAPYRETLRKYRGVYRTVRERCFPGYVFVETDDVKQLFFDLYWIPDFTRLLGREGLTYNFVPLDEDESRMIDILYSKNSDRVTRISDIEVQPGDKILILDGPLSGIETKIKKVDLHKRTVTVEFMLCSRLVEAKVGINIVTKLD